MAPPALSFGAGKLPQDKEVARQLFETLDARGIRRVDTARAYPGSEKTIAELADTSKLVITTKADGWRLGTGKKEAVLQSAKDSLDALGVEKVDTFLIHTPDKTTPFAETLEAIQELYLAGKFDKFGVSNFTAAQVQEVYDIAKSKGYVLPSVYQANYNLLARENETALFPTLRALGISIQVYSAIAGGFLVKSPEDITNPVKGERWDPNAAINVYSNMYTKPELLDYLVKFKALAQEAGISQVSLAYRWVRYHSALGDGDTVILGCYSPKQLESTLDELEKGPLEGWVVDRLEEMGKAIVGVVDADNWTAFSKMHNL